MKIIFSTRDGVAGEVRVSKDGIDPDPRVKDIVDSWQRRHPLGSPEQFVAEFSDWTNGYVVAKAEVEKGKGRLDWSPKKNWVENEGGLPRYIEDIALALIRERHMTRERAIAVAISRVKMWAAGGDNVNADTRAKAAKAVAQWEALKAKARAK